MGAPEPAAEGISRRRIRRGEGEVTQWPRGLLDYRSVGPEDTPPSPEEDRLANRIALAARLLSIRRSEGREIDGAIEALRAAERALAAGDRATATAIVERVLARLGAEATDAPATP